MALDRILEEQKTQRAGGKSKVCFKLINETTRERVDKDWRNGKNISSEEFAKTFGLRVVEFGNWVGRIPS